LNTEFNAWNAQHCRMYPITTVSTRVLNEDLVLCGYHVPKDVSSWSQQLNCKSLLLHACIQVHQAWRPVLSVMDSDNSGEVNLFSQKLSTGDLKLN
jgi:hypothetical protein